MNRLASVAVGVVLIVACSSCRFNTARSVADESPDPFVRMAEVEQKRQRILEEIEHLGSNHPWAGVYRGNLPFQFSLVIAPDSGCVTTIFGCFGLRDSKWSPVRVVADADKDVARAVVAFGERFELTTEASQVVLRGDRGGTYWRHPFEALTFERAR